MLLTDGWKKDVARYVREADVADIGSVDNVGSFYEREQAEIVEAIELLASDDGDVSSEDIFAICWLVLDYLHPDPHTMAHMIFSIKMRLCIE